MTKNLIKYLLVAILVIASANPASAMSLAELAKRTSFDLTNFHDVRSLSNNIPGLEAFTPYSEEWTKLVTAYLTKLDHTQQFHRNNPCLTTITGYSAIIAGVALGYKAADLSDRAAKSMIDAMDIPKNVKRPFSIAAYTGINLASVYALCGAILELDKYMTFDFKNNHPLFSLGARTAGTFFIITMPAVATIKSMLYAVQGSKAADDAKADSNNPVIAS